MNPPMPTTLKVARVLLFITGGAAIVLAGFALLGISLLSDSPSGGAGVPESAVPATIFSSVWLVAYGILCVVLGVVMRKGRRWTFWTIVGIQGLSLVMALVSLSSGWSGWAQLVMPIILLALVLVTPSREFFLHRRSGAPVRGAGGA
ncbi:hypothetical protein ACQEU5_12230 [Marinactinospora thermotolerans]|uniref:Integral membrane protein n=1 Tax=Marinactinospora thermotolerans DSM 45154 TaxID=1122192 RepID=A0A1T4SXH0_9ACTN|nr:hypothetical protein [Marinactinospora thermotolerans]SKA32960.1 hypothetical protein SAMN02745673_04110 [Marinactinospora thermotolerans DSM 45154]